MFATIIGLAFVTLAFFFVVVAFLFVSDPLEIAGPSDPSDPLEIAGPSYEVQNDRIKQNDDAWYAAGGSKN